MCVQNLPIPLFDVNRYDPDMPVTPSLTQLRKELASHASEARRLVSQSFFKTGKGEYAEGDIFIGITVPEVRKCIRNFTELPLKDFITLLQSKIHEERLAALLLLVCRFERGTTAEQEWIFQQYLSHTTWINNWDLVDTSAPQIVGGYLLTRKRDLLLKLIASTNLWERRIAMVSTLHFIRAQETTWTIRLAEQLLDDSHDLMHKAAGWMLREMGKRNLSTLQGFLEEYAHCMPRTMLRYAIEKFPESERRAFLRKRA